MNLKANSTDKIFGMDVALAVLWLEPVGLAFILLLSIGLVIVPKINESLAKMTEIKSVSAKIEEINQKRTYLQTVDQEEIKNNALKLGAGLLPEKSAYLLVRIIRNVAIEAGYSIDDFNVSMGDVKTDDSKKKDNTNYDKIPVAVTLMGPAENYLTLVKSIERSLPIMSIDSFEMSSGGDGVSKIKLNVSAYYLRDITNIKLEALTLADLTPSQKEMDLLSTIGEYKAMAVQGSSGNEVFTKYDRADPFFTP